MAGKNFLVIKHKNITPKAVDIEYDSSWVNSTTQALNNVLKANNIKPTATKSFKNVLKTISNIAPSYKIGNVSRALEEIITNGKVSSKLIESDLLKYANVPLRSVAQQMGYSTFGELYNNIKFDATGLGKVEREKFINANKTAGEQHYTKLVVQHNENRQRIRFVEGIEISLVKSFSHSFDSEVPSKRVENNFDITNSVYNKTGETSFECFIASSNDIDVEDIIEQIQAIRDSKITFDLEFKEYTVGDFTYNKPPIKDCLFASLSYERSTNGINGYDISFSVMPVTKGIVQITSEKLVGTVKTKQQVNNKTSKIKKKSTTKPIGNNKNININIKQGKQTFQQLKDAQIKNLTQSLAKSGMSEEKINRFISQNMNGKNFGIVKKYP